MNKVYQLELHYEKGQPFAVLQSVALPFGLGKMELDAVNHDLAALSVAVSKLNARNERIVSVISSGVSESGQARFLIVTEPIAEPARPPAEHYEELYNNFGGSPPHP